MQLLSLTKICIDVLQKNPNQLYCLDFYVPCNSYSDYIPTL